MDLAAAPANHGLVAMDRFTVAPGASDERGNVEVSCPAGGPACVVSVADDGSVRYESTGGMPSVMSTVMDLAAAPANHGLDAMDRFTVAPGASDERGNVEVSCPAGGPACVVSVADDGSVRYESTGGVPSVISQVLTSERIESILNTRAANSNSGVFVDDQKHFSCAAIGCPTPGEILFVGGAPSILEFSDELTFTEYRRGVSLAETPVITITKEDYFGEYTQNYKTLGGWLEHSFFYIVTRFESSTSSPSPDNFYMMSHGTAPNNADPEIPPNGTSTWSGVMLAVTEFPLTEIGLSPSNFHFVGDATITVDFHSYRLSPFSVDVLFNNIANDNTGVQIEDMMWTDISLENGRFYHSPPGIGGHLDGGSIAGTFYGPNHEEVGGVFKRNVIVGAFGAKRTN